MWKVDVENNARFILFVDAINIIKLLWIINNDMDQKLTSGNGTFSYLTNVLVCSPCNKAGDIKVKLNKFSLQTALPVVF